MSHTQRMVALLAKMRRERNGAVADTMRYDGRRYGLNYGVSLPTVRSLARGEGCDGEFARFLYGQDVRELHLAALHIADPDKFTLSDAGLFGGGIYNSEVAEEAAFALLSRVACFPDIFNDWISRADRPLLQYAAMLAAARRGYVEEAWIARAVGSVRGGCATADISAGRVAHLLAMSAVALLAAAATGRREAVVRAVATLGDTPAERYIASEMEWRL